MRKILALLSLSALVFFVSCSDDEDTNLPPSVTAPGASTVQSGQDVEITFTYTAEAGFASSSATTENGSASVTTDGNAGDVSGSITVTFTGGANAGAGGVILTVTDADGNSDNATAIVNVTAEPVEETVISVTSDVSADATWEAGKTYILEGRIAVTSGTTLTIEGGAIVKGQAGTGANASALVVARGATLNANGTADAPIIFTSTADNIEPGQTVSPNLDPSISGLWGGVIVLGNAPASLRNDAAEVGIEGIPTTDSNGLYGGTAADDNSGTISYISIRHGGSNIGEGNEINGLTLGGVGSGTTISNVEVVANADDGIEWFGGTVDVTGVLIWNSNDDGLDTDQDWQGTCSDFAIVTPIGGSGFELDGPEGTGKVNGADGFHSFDNGVLYAGADIDHLVDWDASTNAQITNLYIFGLDADYLANFADTNPIESFNGDGSGTSASWEVTFPAGATVTTDALGDAAAITQTVSARTVGPDASIFGWTWAGESGALAEIGL
jgi:hypothetical protein